MSRSDMKGLHMSRAKESKGVTIANRGRAKKPIMVGEDGLPLPQLEETIEDHFKKTFLCICPICHSSEAKLQLTQKGSYYVQCKECKIVLYLNHNLSISLFRGLQNLFKSEPDILQNFTEAIIEHAPKDTE